MEGSDGSNQNNSSDDTASDDSTNANSSSNVESEIEEDSRRERRHQKRKEKKRRKKEKRERKRERKRRIKEKAKEKARKLLKKEEKKRKKERKQQRKKKEKARRKKEKKRRERDDKGDDEPRRKRRKKGKARRERDDEGDDEPSRKRQKTASDHHAAAQFDPERLLQSHGLRVNRYGGTYAPGKPLPITTVVQVVIDYHEMFEESGYKKYPTMAELAERTKVGDTRVKEIIAEWKADFSISDKSKFKACRPRGVGALSLSDKDIDLILELRKTAPNRGLENYVRNLKEENGTVVSASTISQLFLHAFPYRANMVKTNLVPYDKYSHHNISRFDNFIEFVATFSARRFKFGDEKHVKNEEVYTKMSRKNPMTGEAAPELAESDFRNAHNLIALMSLNEENPAVFYSMGKNNGTAMSFVATVMYAASVGFFCPWDIFILDNATIHDCDESVDLADLLWNYPGPDGQPLRVLVVKLPTRSPELNPIEKIFNTMVKRLKEFRRDHPKEFRRIGVVNAVAAVLDDMDIDLMVDTAINCGYVKF